MQKNGTTTHAVKMNSWLCEPVIIVRSGTMKNVLNFLKMINNKLMNTNS